MGFPHTPFLTVAVTLPLYRQPYIVNSIAHIFEDCNNCSIIFLNSFLVLYLLLGEGYAMMMIT